MKILILSDSHGNTSYIEEILSRHVYDQVFHLGDSEISKNHFRMRMVRGNSFKDDDLPNSLEFKLDGKTFFLTHGHLYDVNNGLNNLFYKAKSLNADYCMFGHTHIPLFEQVDNCIFINPGSIVRPRAGFSSYMILDTVTNNCTLYNLLGEEIEKYEGSS